MTTKINELAKRIYSNKMIEKIDEKGNVIISDEEAIKALVDKTFTSNGQYTNLEQFSIFNKIIVETADELAEPDIQKIISLIADYDRVGRYDTVVYEIPKKAKISLALTATGSGVDFVRISPSVKKLPAKPQTHQFGVYYQVDKMISDPVNEFRNAVNFVAEAKVKYVFNKILEVVRQAVTASTIPSGQVISTANITIADFRALENKLIRYGNARPIMIADRNLIQSLAEKQQSVSFGITDDLKKELLREIDIDLISKTVALATDNPFIDEANSKVELPVNEGIVIAGGGKKSPIMVRDFGGLRTLQGIPDIEDERVNLKIDMRMDITLLRGQGMGYVKDTAVTL